MNRPLFFVLQMIQPEYIEKLVIEKLEDTNLFLVDVKVGSGNAIKVEIDGEKGVSIDNCVELSRHIEGNLDREQEDFELKVMSAGIGEPLKVDQQYIKNIGRNVDVVLIDGTHYRGKLLKASDEVVIEIPASKKKKTPEQAIELSKDQIKETRVRITF